MKILAFTAIACASCKTNINCFEKLIALNHLIFINSIILRVAEGSSNYLGADGDAQKSALQVIINCVCGPQYKVGILIELLVLKINVCGGIRKI